MKNKVVILLSDKRSGSTMFQSELCRHPAVRHVEYSPHTYLETHHWLKAACMLDVDPVLFSGGTVYAGYGGKKNARIYMEDCIKKNVPGFVVPENDRDLVLQGWNALCERYANPVFFEKSPQLPAHWGALELLLDWIINTDYEVKIIGLVRNPLAVLYSAQQLFHTDPEKRQYGWVEVQENLLKVQERIPVADFKMCKYEDIIREPVAQFKNICEFVGIEPDVSVGSGVHGTSVNKWEKDPFFRVQLDDTVKEMAGRFGYLENELINPEKPLPGVVARAERKIKGDARLLLAHINDRIIAPLRLRKSN